MAFASIKRGKLFPGAAIGTVLLAACTTKALQGVTGHVVTPGHRNLFDGVGHLLNRNLQKALGQRLGRGGPRRMSTRGLIHGFEQLFLVIEIKIEGAFGDACAGGYIVKAGSGVAPFYK